MLRNRAVDTVLTLDPFFAEFAAEHYPAGSKVGVVPDPAFPTAATPANDELLPIRIPEDRCMLLLFGALTARKGVLQLAEALGLLAPVMAGRIAIVIAGKMAPDIQETLEARLAKLRREQPGLWLAVENRWLGSSEIAALVQRSDIILAPYQRFVGSSGVLLWAARAGKPLLTQDYGLLGRLVRDHELGLAVDTTNPRVIADAISRMVEQGGDNHINVMKAANFAAERTPEQFAARIYSSLRQP